MSYRWKSIQLLFYYLYSYYLTDFKMIWIKFSDFDSLLVKNTYPRARLLGSGPSFIISLCGILFLICKGEIIKVSFSYEHCED